MPVNFHTIGEWPNSCVSPLDLSIQGSNKSWNAKDLEQFQHSSKRRLSLPISSSSLFSIQFQQLMVNLTNQIQTSLDRTRLKYEKDLEELHRSYRLSLNDLHNLASNTSHSVFSFPYSASFSSRTNPRDSQDPRTTVLEATVWDAAPLRNQTFLPLIHHRRREKCVYFISKEKTHAHTHTHRVKSQEWIRGV